MDSVTDVDRFLNRPLYLINFTLTLRTLELKGLVSIIFKPLKVPNFNVTVTYVKNLPKSKKRKKRL